MKKIIRRQNKKLLAETRKEPCIICGALEVDAAHIKSVGAGGHDELENILPLCRACHTKQHQFGWFKLCKENPGLVMSLKSLGWELVEEFGVWRLRRIA